MSTEQNKNFSASFAIIIAGGIIAVAIIVSGFIKGGNIADNNKKVANNDTSTQQTASVDNILPVTSKDHILGDPNAKVVVVEFSDLECPFCKRFHPTMQKIVDEYGKDGRVAWVYRHFPLDSIHSRTRKEAEASECAAELGGNGTFWKYINRIFEVTPSNNGLDPNELFNIAEYVGLDRVKFSQCLNSGRYAQKVESDLQDAIASGGRGTPYSVVITNSGKKFTIDGAQPYNVVKRIIDNALLAN